LAKVLWLPSSRGVIAEALRFAKRMFDSAPTMPSQNDAIMHTFLGKRRKTKRKRVLSAAYLASGNTAHRGARASPSQIYTSIKTAFRA